MPADITWLARGVDTRRWNMQAASQHTSDVGTRQAQVVIPGMHGVIVDPLQEYEAFTVTLEFFLKGAMVSLVAAEHELKRALYAPGLVLSLDAGGLITSAPAKCLGLSQGEFVAEAVAKFTAQIMVPGAFLRGPSTDIGPTVVTSGASVDLPALAAGSGPVADAVLRVRGPFSVVAVADDASGTGSSWSGTALLSTDYLFVDLATMTARRSTSSSAWTTGGTDVSGGLSRQALGSLQLQPTPSVGDVAVPECSVTVTGTGFGATTALTVRAQPAYL